MCVDHHYHASFILKQSQVTIVGQVISMQKHDTKDVYFLDDGTGILEAHYRHADTNNEEVQYWKNVNELFEEDGKIRWVTFHNLLIKILELRSLYTYAHVVGDIRSIGEQKYLNATHIRLIVDPQEINLHLLETVAWLFSIAPPTMEVTITCP